MRLNWWIVSGVVVLIVAVLVGTHGTKATPATSAGASISISLNVVPTTRSISVSPGTATFGNCRGGAGQFASNGALLGYPNGSCRFGQPGASGNFPIEVKNTGSNSRIYVNGSSAAPSDGGTPWRLCNLPPDPAAACTSAGGTLPGADQFLVQNFGAGRTQNISGLTDHPVCDIEFGSAGSCSAAPGQSQKEGVGLIGPYSSQDFSTSWTVTITWTAAPP